MWNRSGVCFLLLGCIVGCGKSEPAPNTGPVDSVPLAAESEKDATAPAEPTSPPGKIELPKDFDASAVPAEVPQTEEKQGGFELPVTGGGSLPPVVAQRPVLEDSAAAEIKLTAAPLATSLERAAKAGRVCVVDVWSLSCEPCLKEFPGLVQLSEELADKVVCLSINVDYDGRKKKPAETYRASVEAFLKSTGADFENYLCETPNEEVFAALKIASIPAVLVYDQNGKLVRTFTDTGDDVGFGYANDVAPLVRSLVSP